MGSPWRSRAAHGIQGVATHAIATVEGGVSRVKLQICTSWTQVTLTNIQLLCFDHNQLSQPPADPAGPGTSSALPVFLSEVHSSFGH